MDPNIDTNMDRDMDKVIDMGTQGGVNTRYGHG
jgi:hypothetical protein